MWVISRLLLLLLTCMWHTVGLEIERVKFTVVYDYWNGSLLLLQLTSREALSYVGRDEFAAFAVDC